MKETMELLTCTLAHVYDTKSFEIIASRVLYTHQRRETLLKKLDDSSILFPCPVSCERITKHVTSSSVNFPDAPSPVSSPATFGGNEDTSDTGYDARAITYGDRLDILFAIACNTITCASIRGRAEHYNIDMLYTSMLWQIPNAVVIVLEEFSRYLPDEALRDPVKWLLQLLCMCSLFDDLVDKIWVRMIVHEVCAVCKHNIPCGSKLRDIAFCAYVGVTTRAAADDIDLIIFEEYVEYVNVMVTDMNM